MIIIFMITSFLSFDAMVASTIPGVIALLGSSIGVYVSAYNIIHKPKTK